MGRVCCPISNGLNISKKKKKALQNDIKEIYEEAKSANFDVKAIKQLLKIRKMDDQERQEEEFVLDVYKRALGLD